MPRNNTDSRVDAYIDVVPRSRTGRFALAALIIGGLALRLSRLLENRPLWTDEAKLALGIGRLDYLGLLHSLDYNQVAPILYVWLMKALTSLFGMHEWVLRLPALIAGSLVVAIIWLVGKRTLSEAGALVAVALTATAPLLIAYSAEAKPYELDACVSAILLLFALRVNECDDHRRRLTLGLLGVLGIGLSFPAVFVLGAIGATLIVSAAFRRDWTSAVTMLLCSMVWMGVFFLQRHLTYADATTDEVMQNFWRGVMIRIGEPGWVDRLIVSLRSAILSSTDPGWRPLKYFAPMTILIGTIVIWKRSGKTVALLLVASLGLALLASALALWPIDGRLALFFAPVAFLWIAAVADLAWNLSSYRAALRGMIVALGFFGVAFNVMHPSPFPPFESSRELIASLSARRAAAPVYVFPVGVPAWVFYTTNWRHPDLARLDWYARMNPRRIAPSRGGAVTDDEPALEWSGTGGLELVGRFTGMQFVMDRGWTTTGPDPNWGNTEMKRLAARTSDFAWVFGSHLPASQIDSLREGLKQNGGEMLDEDSRSTSVLWRIRFRPKQ
jgi:4-amino-4-deoxy-L-arabinose transferase-like glycosyltransferase